MSRSSNNATLRRQIACEAARILSEHGSRDYRSARLKAAARLGLQDSKLMPSNAEIQQALSEHLRLFHHDSQPRALEQLRRLALEAMQAFKAFDPRLTGPVLDGTADADSSIQLYLFTETPEEIIFKLNDMNIPWREEESRLRHSNNRYMSYPTFLIHAKGTAIRMIVLPLSAIRNPPLSPITLRPEQGASITLLENLLAQSSVCPGTEYPKA